MFTVTVESGFTASHALLMPDGVREPRHPHAWRVRVAVRSETLDASGLAIDFVELKRMIDDITGPMDGVELEALPCFQGKNASAEHVARYVYGHIAGRLAGRATLESVGIMEAQGCWVTYRE